MKTRTLIDAQKDYKKSVDKEVSQRDYLDTNYAFNEFLISLILEGHTVYLPERLGSLCVQGKKQKYRVDKNGKPIGLSPDWVETKKLWDRNPKAKKEKKLLYHTNEHTNGYRYKILWSKLNMYVKNKNLYTLKMTRKVKRAVSKEVINNYGKFKTRL